MMKDLSPKKQDLESIEIASIDEIKALQLNRLKWPGRRVVTEVVNLPTEYRTTPVKATSNTPATKIQVINPINVGNRHMVEVPREFGFSGILQLQG